VPVSVSVHPFLLPDMPRVAAHGMDGWGCALGLMGPAFGNGRPGPE